MLGSGSEADQLRAASGVYFSGLSSSGFNSVTSKLSNSRRFFSSKALSLRFLTSAKTGIESSTGPAESHDVIGIGLLGSLSVSLQ